jgi:hypothetical protein
MNKIRYTERTITSLKRARQTPRPRSSRPPAPADGRDRRREPLPIRSAERRRWTTDLLGPAVAGLVVHGDGGMGKSTLAAAITARVGQLEPGRVPVLLTGEVSADGVLAALGAALRASPAVAVGGGLTPAGAAAVDAAGRPGQPWAHRLAGLREHVLGQVPVLVVLDDFDDNTSAGSAPADIRDPDLAALLQAWLREPGLSRLLVTCRQPFALPGATQALGLRELGPLSRSAAAELARSLPACRWLAEAEIDLAWRLLGGHPLAMEYLDSVLGVGRAGFPGVAARLGRAIAAATGYAVPDAAPGTGYGPPAGAPREMAALAVAACDALLGDLWDGLSTDAQAVLIGVSVYRVPVTDGAPLLPAGPGGRPPGLAGSLAECTAAGLIRTGPGGVPGTVAVHRWTGSQLHRRLAGGPRAAELAAAHRRAAGYWQQRVGATLPDPRVLAELRYHLAAAAAVDQGSGPSARPTVSVSGRRLRVATAVTAAAAVLTGGALAVGHLASSAGPGRAAGAARSAPSGPVLSRAAARGQAAAWVAGQVSRQLTVACDPDMCAALRAAGFPGHRLLVVRPGAAAPPAAALIVLTPVLRAQLGAQLAARYAPGMLAGFGAGPGRIEVRAVAAGDAPAYRAGLATDLAERRAAGNQLLRNPSVSAATPARAELAAGQVDGRLLITLATMAAAEPVHVLSFADSGPGAGSSIPLRAAEITAAGPAGAADGAGDGAAQNGGGLGYLLAFAKAQRPPYRPALARIVRDGPGGRALRIEFTAPSPFGLLPRQ